jgi:hypothetical protein
MDPLTLSTAAATIVQLIGMYRQERGARKDLDHRDFIEWLEYHRHEDIKELITHTFKLQSQVDDLLRQDHREILNKLSEVNRIVSDILARMDSFKAVALAISPDVGLSDQALGFLRLLARSETAELAAPGEGQIIVDNFLYEAVDKRFLDDDLRTLAQHGFVTPGSRSSTGKYFKLTRRGAKLIELLPPGNND